MATVRQMQGSWKPEVLHEGGGLKGDASSSPRSSGDGPGLGQCSLCISTYQQVLWIP